jgi:hypothetical protein
MMRKRDTQELARASAADQDSHKKACPIYARILFPSLPFFSLSIPCLFFPPLVYHRYTRSPFQRNDEWHGVEWRTPVGHHTSLLGSQTEATRGKP